MAYNIHSYLEDILSYPEVVDDGLEVGTCQVCGEEAVIISPAGMCFQCECDE
jgi:hypothetical protein